jgi:hypothetical protein
MPQSKVLFDSGSTDALFTLAAHEGLLQKKSNKEDDGLFQHILERKVQNWHKEHVLTQVTLSSNVETLSSKLGWPFLTGGLIEDGIVRKIEYKNPVNLKPLKMPSEIISALLQARGIDIPISEFQSRYQYGMKCLEEHDQYFKKRGIEPPNVWEEIASMGVEDYKKYSKADFEMANRLQEAYRSFKPIPEVINEYAMLAEVSSGSGALLGTPSLPSLFAEVEYPLLIPRNIGDSEELRLFRITCECLGRLPRGRTLKESIALSKDPATIDLRLRIQDWKNELQQGKLNELEIIQRDIKKTIAALKDAHNSDKVGNVVTWLSGPIGIIEALMGIPSFLGISVAVVGNIASANRHIKKSKNKWVSFNTKNY